MDVGLNREALIDQSEQLILSQFLDSLFSSVSSEDFLAHYSVDLGLLLYVEEVSCDKFSDWSGYLCGRLLSWPTFVRQVKKSLLL